MIKRKCKWLAARMSVNEVAAETGLAITRAGKILQEWEQKVDWLTWIV